MLAQAQSGNAFIDFNQLLKKFNAIKDKIAGMKDVLASNYNKIKDNVMETAGIVKNTLVGKTASEIDDEELVEAGDFSQLNSDEQWLMEDIKKEV